MTQRFPFRAVIFDFDGTLADSYAAIAASVNHVRALRGLPALSEADVCRYVGRGPHYLLRHMIPNGAVEADLVEYRAHHPTVMYSHTRLLPGAAELVRRLKDTGRLVALCSNKPRFFSQDLLNHLGIGAYFDVVVGPEDVPNPKPAPDMVLAALRRLEVPAEQTLYIGDMVVDIETARSAKVCVWVVPTGSDLATTLAAAQPDRAWANLLEILAEI